MGSGGWVPAGLAAALLPSGCRRQARCRLMVPSASLPPAGARSDSYYEYLLKQWLLTGRSQAWLRERYVLAMRSVRAR